MSEGNTGQRFPPYAIERWTGCGWTRFPERYATRKAAQNEIDLCGLAKVRVARVKTEKTSEK